MRVKKMSILETISKPAGRAAIITLLGDAGLGKTSTAATFPNPIFIRAEDGLQSIPSENMPDAFPVIENVENLWDQLKSLIREEHDYKTVVIDSVTALESLFSKYILDTYNSERERENKKPVDTINSACGGYGAGFNAVGALHGRVRKACGVLNNKKGMHVIFIAHADTETIDLPDQDAYTRYSMRLNKKSQSPYIDESDIVGFLKLKSFTRGEEGRTKKVISNGDRVICTSASASCVSKNRFGIRDDISVQFGVNPFIGYIPSLENERV